jgi:16S rRNA (adenine1518-N6/adenine1519-N6)-dimethyltransferase
VARSSSTGRRSAPERARATQGHVARKRFGQHFLIDRHYIDRIVSAVDPRPGDNLVEIGPGLGALTRLLLGRVEHVNAIEIDRDLAAKLSSEFAPDRLNVRIADALAFDFAALGPDLRVVGNLPYYISSPLLFHLAAFDAKIRDITVMLQKEVVDRMVAQPASPDYGRLSITLQVRFRIERLFTVPPGAFRPPPKVESAVARLIPLREAGSRIADERLFAAIVAAAFGQRRKTLRNALRSFATEEQLERARIDPAARGETLAVGDFVRLAELLAAESSRQ